MATYKHESGEVVHLVDKSFEDTRIGALVLDRKGGWAKVEEATGPSDAVKPSDGPAAPKPAPKPKAD